MNRFLLRRALLTPATQRSFVRATPLQVPPRARTLATVAEPSFWKSLVPKPLRARSPTTGPNKNAKARKGWNPATFFIAIFMLIGSMSIQMIALKMDFDRFMRQSDVRIGLLREVVEKLQRGEEVDVDRVLGTGDPEKELDWEKVLKEIEREEPAKSPRKKQPEPTPSPPPAPAPAPSRKADAAPVSEPARAPVQNTLASKGFF